MAWSEDDVVESGSITIVDITAEGEVAPLVSVKIDDEEAQLEVDDAERGDIVAIQIKNFINAGIFPAIIKGAAFKDLKKTTSFLNRCDVRLIDKDKVEWFICLLAFKKDPKRWFEVQLGTWSAEQSISYNAFTTRKWQ
jgi:hypothetical protein